MVTHHHEPVRILWSLVVLLAGTVAAAAERPNILLVVSEDHGPQLGCYGDRFARTPHLDRLAAEGVRFTRAWVTQAGCSPSRASFLTGLHPHQHGQVGLSTWGFRMFRADTPNVVRSLRDAGYRTGMVGKLHVVPEEAFPLDFHRIDRGNFARERLGDYARFAEEFIRGGDAPFFLAVNFPDAHDPWPRQVDGLPPEPLDGDDVEALPGFGIDTPQLRAAVADYSNCIMRLDTLVGDLLAALDRSGKADDTLVVFMGDHGPDMLRGKRTCYEGGLRIPMLLRFPRRVPPGQVRDELVSSIDLVPTFLEVAGAEPIPGLGGRSLLPLLAGGTVAWRATLFAEYHTHAAASNCFPQRAARDARYKLIENLLPDEVNPGVAYTFKEFHSGPAAVAAASEEVRAAYRTMERPPRYELYDLEADPHEFVNVADDPVHAAARAELAAALDAWRRETADPFLDPALVRRFDDEVKAVRSKAKANARPWGYLDYLAGPGPAPDAVAPAPSGRAGGDEPEGDR